ncbi:MAG: phosphoribosylformylglycinamidine synthase I [Sedimentisphaerales bacterium]|nr:phosphoribosylformylglycinamidine synthase I [Sedimentisphaerales bacterium]
MAGVNVLVLRAAGINCDLETQYAFEQAGASAQRIHINRLIERKDLLDQFHILVIPGGFSYGDDVAAGRILANQLIHHLEDQIYRFIEQGRLVLGICNGFQVLVKSGILPGLGGSKRQEHVSITWNDSGRYEDRWVYLEPQGDRCVFLEPGRRLYLPVAHAEGKVVVSDQQVLESLQQGGFIALKYVDQEGKEGPYPINPNGSVASIAALTDTTGRVLGLMPHPERFIHPTHHPHWTRLGRQIERDGMTIFSRAVQYVRQAFLS